MQSISDWFGSFAEHLVERTLALSPDGTVLAFNKRALKFLPGLQPGDNLLDSVRDRMTFLHYLRMASRSAATIPGRVAFAHSDMGWRCDASNVTVDQQRLVFLTLRESSDTTRQFLALNQKIRQLKVEIRRRIALEEEREQLLRREQVARQSADAANKAKDDLLASVSHELRTPLHAIQGWLELIQDTELDASTRAQAFEVINRNVQAQNQLTNDLVDLAAVVSGRLSLEMYPVDLAELVDHAVKSAMPDARQRNQSLSLTLEETRCEIKADQTRMMQVVGNLLSNACKYTPDGGRIEVTLRRQLSHAEIVIKDSGQGIPAEMLPYVFDRFHRAVNATTRRQGGLGIGLSIARHLVEMHGGVIVVESDGPGLGSSFTVSLPLPVFHPVNAVEEGEQLDPDTSLETEGLRVLLVEDHEDSRALLASLLRSRGAMVLEAENSLAALETFGATPVHIIISDIEMPDEDGFTMMRKLRAMERATMRQPTPAIAVSAHNIGDAHEHALRAGFHTFVPKPVAPKELLKTVVKLYRRSMGGELPRPEVTLADHH